MLSHIFDSFSKNGIIHQLKKYFSKSFFAFFLRSLFISMYGFIQAFWLNLITLRTFFKTNPWFNAYFKFLMCKTYSVLSYKSTTSFWLFQSLFFQVKMVNLYEILVSFQDISFQKISFIAFFIIVFYEIFIKLRSIF